MKVELTIEEIKRARNALACLSYDCVEIWTDHMDQEELNENKRLSKSLNKMLPFKEQKPFSFFHFSDLYGAIKGAEKGLPISVSSVEY